MKVTGYRTRAVKVPINDLAVVENMATHVLVEIQTDEGIEGISYASRIAPAHVGEFIGTLNGFLDRLIGRDPLMTEEIVTPRHNIFGPKSLFRRGGTWPGYQTRITATIDVALWDIKGKAAGLPAHVLMGGFRHRVPAYASWGIEPGTEEAKNLGASAARLVERGFTSMKFHTRNMSAAETVAHTRTIREAVGPDVDIMIDNYQGWSLKEAITFCKQIEPYGPFWLEDPMALEDYQGMRQLRDAVPIRICAGEQYRDIASFRELLEHRSVDIAMIDLDVTITGFLKIAHMAEAFNVPVVTHLATELMAPALAAVPNGMTVEYIPWAAPLFNEQMVVENGELVLSQEPGYGLSFDEKSIARLTA